MVDYKRIDFFVADKSIRPLIGTEFAPLLSQGEHDFVCGNVKFLESISGEGKPVITNSANNETTNTPCRTSYEGVFLNHAGNIVDARSNEFVQSDSDILIFMAFIGIAGIIIGFILEEVRRWLFF